MRQTSFDSSIFRNFTQSVQLFALATVFTLITLNPCLNAAGASNVSKKHAVKLGDFLAGMHAQVVQDAKAAVRFFRSNLVSNPDNINIKYRIFSILVSQGKIKEALPLAEKLIKSEFADVNLPLLVLALRDIRAGQFENAIKKLDKLPKKGINE